MRGLKKWFDQHLGSLPDETKAGTHQLNIATAALLFEVLRADHKFTDREMSEFRVVLTDFLKLQESEISEMVTLAEQEVDAATSLYQFTSQITKHFGPAERAEIIRNMWRLAYADNHLDKYEEHLIRKTASLIHVSRAAFARARESAKADIYSSE